MQKARFKYKVGQSVRFKYYDGSIHNGVIQSRCYRNEDSDYLDTQYGMTMYTCHSSDTTGRYSRGYMVYPALTENMIQFELDRPHIIKPLSEIPNEEIGTKTVVTPIQDEVTETLDDAIARQKEFLNR